MGHFGQAKCTVPFYLCQTSHEGNKSRTKAKELLRAFCPNIHTVISYFIRWERRLPSSGLLNTTTGFGSLVGIVFAKAVKTDIILLIDQEAKMNYVRSLTLHRGRNQIYSFHCLLEFSQSLI